RGRGGGGGRRGGGSGALLAAGGPAALPRRARRYDRDDDPDDYERAHEADAAQARAAALESLGDELHLVRVREATVVLVDVEVPVKAQVVGVRAQKSLDVRVARKEFPTLFLERLEVAIANPYRILDVGRREVALPPRLPQAPTDLEHAALSRTPAGLANAA